MTTYNVKCTSSSTAPHFKFRPFRSHSGKCHSHIQLNGRYANERDHFQTNVMCLCTHADTHSTCARASAPKAYSLKSSQHSRNARDFYPHRPLKTALEMEMETCSLQCHTSRAPRRARACRLDVLPSGDDNKPPESPGTFHVISVLGIYLSLFLPPAGYQQKPSTFA